MNLRFVLSPVLLRLSRALVILVSAEKLRKTRALSLSSLGLCAIASYGKLSGEIAAEFPLSIDNTALQVVPDYRLRASVALRF